VESTEYIISNDPEGIRRQVSPSSRVLPIAIVRKDKVTDSTGKVVGTNTIAARVEDGLRHIDVTASSDGKSMSKSINIKEHAVPHALFPVPDSIHVITSKTIGETPLSPIFRTSRPHFL
jgi:hypothetical protein